MYKPLSALLLAVLLLSTPMVVFAADALKLVVLGDSLTAGYGLPQSSAFPQRLQAQLRMRGHQVEVINAGVSGDTSAGGLARLEWSLADRPDLMIVELGANDALRGLDPQQTKKNLAAILSRLRSAGVRTLLVGMKAPRNLGAAYYTKFDTIYTELAREHRVPLYPFFLDGVAGQPNLNLSDGIHPNAAGIEIIVQRIVPLVERTLLALRQDKKTKNKKPA